MSEVKPNAYRVVLLEMDEHHYSLERTYYWHDLHHLPLRADRIKSVTPVYVQNFEPLTREQIRAVLADNEAESRRKADQSRLLQLEAEVAQLRKKLTKQDQDGGES